MSSSRGPRRRNHREEGRDDEHGAGEGELKGDEAHAEQVDAVRTLPGGSGSARFATMRMIGTSRTSENNAMKMALTATIPPARPANWLPASWFGISVTTTPGSGARSGAFCAR